MGKITIKLFNFQDIHKMKYMLISNLFSNGAKLDDKILTIIFNAMFYKEIFKMIQKLYHQVYQTFLSKRQQMKVIHFYRIDKPLTSIEVTIS